MTAEEKRTLKAKLAKFNPFTKTDKFYDIRPLVCTAYDEGADYIIPLGKRSKGKSYAIKKVILLWEAYWEAECVEYIKHKKIVPKKRYQFGYMRRWDKDITELNVLDYFKDFIVPQEGKKENLISEITNGEYNDISMYRGVIYFAKNDGEGKIEKGKEIGRTFAVNISTRYKSRMFPLIGNVVYEEFLPEKDIRYVQNEVSQFTSIISTIARNDRIRVILVGNTISRVCPYFQEWGLRNTLKQKPGTLEKYNIDTGDKDEDGNPIIIRLMVEMTSADGCSDYTTITHRKAIVNGEWDSDFYPHLPEFKTINDYEVRYEVIFDDLGFCFKICLIVIDEPVLFVYPYTGDFEKVKRRITEEYSESRFVTRAWDKVTKYDELCRNLVKNKKILFSDNLTGTDFYNVISQRGGI